MIQRTKRLIANFNLKLKLPFTLGNLMDAFFFPFTSCITQKICTWWVLRKLFDNIFRSSKLLLRLFDQNQETSLSEDQYSSFMNSSMSLDRGTIIAEPYSSLWNSSTIYVRLHSTQVHQTRVQDTHNSSLRSSSTSWHFLIPKIQFSQCYGEMFTRNSSLLNSSIIWNSSLRNSSTKKVVVC